VREWLNEHRDELEANWDRARQPRGAETRRAADMNELIKVTDVQPLEGHWLRLSFSDGAVKDVDVRGLLEAGGVFGPIRDSRPLFEQVSVNPETRTVEWPGQVDLDPDVLYGRYEPASLVRIDRRTVREPKSAAHA
jgi:hypothetical protein